MPTSKRGAQVISLMKPPAADKASAAKLKKRKSRAKFKTSIKQLIARDNDDFKAIVLAYTGASPQSTFSSQSSFRSQNSLQSSVLFDINKIRGSNDLCSARNASSSSVSGCSSERHRVTQDSSSPQPSASTSQLLELLKAMSIIVLNSHKFLPSAESEDGHVSIGHVISGFAKLLTQLSCPDVQSQHVWIRLLSQYLQLGAISSSATGCPSNVGETSASGINTLLTLSCVILLNHIALRSASHGF
ncbi:hypothetical protein KP509_19G047500 [Ceratopteris richardii]|uniref:Uncharacterized protein n=1 Tax=Ceratopteris richardii TaxID=49495 RepID=A0A8T2SNA5_CERRI|nr:hypothetical protein KP509_19G047500 [Ceratopteris richardii]